MNTQQNPRKDFLNWEDFFMKMAELNAQRSKDPNTQVGACLIDSQNRVLGNGYNGMPRGCPDDQFPWNKPEKHLYVCHAEMNALLNVNNWSLVPGARLYSTLFPCNECAKMIIQSGVKEVIYKDTKPHNFPASQKMFQSAGVSYRKYLPKNQPTSSQIQPASSQTQTQPNSNRFTEKTVNLLDRLDHRQSDLSDQKNKSDQTFFDKILEIVPERIIWTVVLTAISLEFCKPTKLPEPFLLFFSLS